MIYGAYLDAYRLIYSRSGQLLLAWLLVGTLAMGACHSSYDDWMNN
jgi:hypothetical protein